MPKRENLSPIDDNRESTSTNSLTYKVNDEIIMGLLAEAHNRGYVLSLGDIAQQSQMGLKTVQKHLRKLGELPDIENIVLENLKNQYFNGEQRALEGIKQYYVDDSQTIEYLLDSVSGSYVNLYRKLHCRQKICDVLKQATLSTESISRNEIARRTGLARTTVCRHLDEMIHDSQSLINAIIAAPRVNWQPD